MVLLLLTMIAFTQPCLVDGRALRPEVKQSKAGHPEAVVRQETTGKGSVSRTASTIAGRLLGRSQGFFTMASGPSRKGSGH